MITIRLKGGMGNQMFQYAFARQLAHTAATNFQLDLTDLLDRSKGDFVYRDYDLPVFRVKEHFSLPTKLVRLAHKPRSSRLSGLVKRRVRAGKTHVKEPHFHFAPGLLQSPTGPTLYEGWFQSPKYFAAVEPGLREDFQFSRPLLPTSAALHEQIRGMENAVCLNVRRTDFLKVDTLNTTNRDYFLRAADYVAERVTDPYFFVFSDDVAWCRDQLQLPYKSEVVGHEHKGYKFGNYLRLMATCRHFIIPNSSYAWWAVWLSGREEAVVVAPQRWFNGTEYDTSDLVPQHWVRL